MGVRVKDDGAKALVHGLLDYRHHSHAPPESAVAGVITVRSLGQRQDVAQEEDIASPELGMTDQPEGHVFVRTFPVHGLLEEFTEPKRHSKLDLIHLGRTSDAQRRRNA
jgi:hypothetical protein